MPSRVLADHLTGCNSVNGGIRQLVRSTPATACESGSGPADLGCRFVNHRRVAIAVAANAMHPDADVSIHADGGPASGHGFHVNYSAPPLNDAQSGPAVQLATVLRDAMVAAGMQPSTYGGSNGLYGRADLAGLNLARTFQLWGCGTTILTTTVTAVTR